MTAARLNFMKLIVRDMPRMKAFYEAAFGFAPVNGFDTPEFEEIMLRQGEDPFLILLLSYKDGRRHPDAAAHGPTGFVSEDVQASVDRAVAAGATVKMAPFEVGPTRVAFLADPEGHEIEIIQFL